MSNGWTSSIPRGQAGLLVETALFGVAVRFAALLVGCTRWARAGVRRDRVVEQAAVVALGGGALYGVAAAAARIDPAWLARPSVSVCLILVATALFYLARAAGIATLWRAARPAR